MALDIEKLGNPADYKKRVDDMIDEIKNSKKADGFGKIYYPGEIEAEKLDNCLKEGYIIIADETMESVERVERELNI